MAMKEESKLEVPTICKAYFEGYVREYPHKIRPHIVQYIHFRILTFPLTRWALLTCALPDMFDFFFWMTRGFFACMHVCVYIYIYIHTYEILIYTPAFLKIGYPEWLACFMGMWNTHHGRSVSKRKPWEFPHLGWFTLGIPRTPGKKYKKKKNTHLSLADLSFLEWNGAPFHRLRYTKMQG